VSIADLLARKVQLEAQAGPLRERLQRCEEAIAALDEAQAWRDRRYPRAPHLPHQGIKGEGFWMMQ